MIDRKGAGHVNVAIGTVTDLEHTAAARTREGVGRNDGVAANKEVAFLRIEGHGIRHVDGRVMKHRFSIRCRRDGEVFGINF